MNALSPSSTATDPAPQQASPDRGGATPGAAGTQGAARQSGRGQTVAQWATAVAARVDLPARALVAYGSAEVRLHTALPGCHLSWVSLAGIGRIESNHGRYGGAHLLPNGDESQPVMGVPLDGTNGNAAISSSGDYAHALGRCSSFPRPGRPGPPTATATACRGPGRTGSTRRSRPRRRPLLPHARRPVWGPAGPPDPARHGQRHSHFRGVIALIELAHPRSLHGAPQATGRVYSLVTT